MVAKKQHAETNAIEKMRALGPNACIETFSYDTVPFLLLTDLILFGPPFVMLWLCSPELF